MASLWFETHEANLTSWALFQQEPRRAFAGDHRKETAEVPFRSRIQQPNGTLTSFTEDTLRLLRRADPCATKMWKIHFLIRGIKEDIFNTMIRDPPPTVPNFVTIAIRTEPAASSRTHHHQRFPESNSLGNSQCTVGCKQYAKSSGRSSGSFIVRRRQIRHRHLSGALSERKTNDEAA